MANKDADMATGSYDQSFQDAYITAIRAARKAKQPKEPNFYGHSKAGKSDKFYSQVQNVTGC